MEEKKKRSDRPPISLRRGKRGLADSAHEALGVSPRGFHCILFVDHVVIVLIFVDPYTGI
jgi:hypothetical protein